MSTIKLTNLTKLETKLKKKTRLLRKMGSYQVTSTMLNFQAEGRPDKWPPLAESTIQREYLGGNKERKRKRKLGGKAYRRYRAGKKMLIDTGMLRQSVNYQVKGNAVEVGPGGAATDYARIHNEGGMAGRGRKTPIPKRTYLLVLPMDRKRHKELARIHMRIK